MTRLEEILQRCEAAKATASRYYSADCHVVTQALMKAVEGLNRAHYLTCDETQINERCFICDTLAEIEKMLEQK